MPALMTEQQYRQMLSNRSRRSIPLFASGTVDALLSAAARDARKRELAEEAWRAITPPEWSEQAYVASLREGMLIVEAGSAAVRERIRRQAGTLQRQLKVRVPGLIGLRVTAPGDDDGPREEVD